MGVAVVSEAAAVGEPDPSRQDHRPGRAESLTRREVEVLTLIARGRSNAEIAALLHLSENTVKSYVRQLYRRIGVTSRTQAVLWASRNGYLPDL